MREKRAIDHLVMALHMPKMDSKILMHRCSMPLILCKGIFQNLQLHIKSQPISILPVENGVRTRDQSQFATEK